MQVLGQDAAGEAVEGADGGAVELRQRRPGQLGPVTGHLPGPADRGAGHRRELVVVATVGQLLE